VGWAKRARKQLREDGQAVIKPRGNSMDPIIRAGATVTLKPANPTSLKKGDVVFVKVKGRDYLHLIKALRRNQALIGNNKGGINGWASLNSVYGLAVEINNPES